MYGRKKKPNQVKVMKPEDCSMCGDTQHKVPKAVEESKKVKPKEVFGSAYAGANAKPNKKKQLRNKS